MRLYEPTVSTLNNPVPGRVIERDDAILGLIEMRGGTLELDRDELVALASAARDVLQRVDAALDRRAAGVRPIPAHGQPARPYTAVVTATGTGPRVPVDNTSAVMTPPPPGVVPPARGVHARAQDAQQGQAVVPGPSPAAAAP